MRGLQIKKNKKGPSASEQVGSGGVNYATNKGNILKGKKRQTSYSRLSPDKASEMAKSRGEGDKKFAYSYTDKMGNVNKSVKFNEKNKSLDLNTPDIKFPGFNRTPKDKPPGGGSTFKDKLKKKATSIKENIQSSRQKRQDLREQNKKCKSKKGFINKCEDFGKDLFSTKRKNKSLKRKSARRDRQVRRMKH